MSRRAFTAVATAIATTLATAATASAAPPPKALTNQYPLGTQTLCCQSQSATSPGTSSAPPHTGTTPAPSTAHRQPAATSRPHTSHHSRTWIPILLGAVAVAVVLVDWLVFRRSRQVLPRPRRRVPPALLVALWPIYRYDDGRDAWILRAVGNRWGPVLRRKRHAAAQAGENEDVDPKRTLELAIRADRARRTPDPFDPETPSRTRTRRDERARRDDRSGEARQEQEPPPLVIRRRRD